MDDGQYQHWLLSSPALTELVSQSLGTEVAESHNVGSTRVMRVIARMNVGGPAVQVSGLMRELPPSEFEQVLITGYCADDEADYLETQAPDVPATRIEGLGRAIRTPDDARALGTLIGHMRRFRPHIVHTHTAKAGVLGRLAAKLSGTRPKIVHTYHGHLLHGYFSPAKTRAVIAMERGLARQTHRLVAVGDQVRDDLLHAGIGRLDQYTVIPPGLTLNMTLSRQGARLALGLDDRPVIAFIGRLTRIKRPDRFAEVSASIQQLGYGVQFLVAGDGDEAQRLAAEIAHRHLPIQMLGWRSDIDVILAASDAVILTSDNEGTPISLIQAALAGIPVVATDVGSVKDVVTDGHTGWLTAPTAPALTQAVQQFLDDPAQGRSFGEQAQSQARLRYGVERLARDYAHIYRNVMISPSR